MEEYSENLLKSYRYNTILLKGIKNNNSPNCSVLDKNILEKIRNDIKIVDLCIDMLDFPYKNILYYKYIYGYNYYQIARKMNYSIQRIYQLRKKALLLFGDNVIICRKEA